MSDSGRNDIFFILEVVALLLEPSKRPCEIECDTRLLCYDQRFSHGFKYVLTVVGGFPVWKSSEGKVQDKNWQIKLRKGARMDYSDAADPASPVSLPNPL